MPTLDIIPLGYFTPMCIVFKLQSKPYSYLSSFERIIIHISGLTLGPLDNVELIYLAFEHIKNPLYISRTAILSVCPAIP